MSNELCRSQNHVKEADFVRALNAEYPRFGMERFEKRYRASPNSQAARWEIPDWVLADNIQPVPPAAPRGSHLRRSVEKYRATQRQRAALIGKYLRELVDAWLETGRNPDGSESPLNRKLTAPLRLLVQDYLGKFPSFNPHLSERGIEIEIAYPDGPTTDRGAIEGSRNFFEAQQLSALRLFVGMLASQWRERVCKCRDPRCDVYFLTKTARQRHPSGPFCCREHAKHTSAVKCMRENRSSVKAALIAAAAKYLSDRGNGPSWVARTSVKVRVVQHLSKLLEKRAQLRTYRYQVRRNWVTLHQDAIEQKRLELASKGAQRALAGKVNPR